jgi:hypothetical protein
MSTNIKPLQDAIKLICDLAVDSVHAGSVTGSSAKLAEYQNILPDLLILLPEIGDLPTSVTSLSEADISTLIGTIGDDLSFPPGKAQNIVQASLKLLEDIAGYIVPDVEAIITAAHSA